MNCRICLEDITENELYLNLTCNHKFHYDCISKMQNNLCPLCRKDNEEFLIDNGIEILNEENTIDDTTDDTPENSRTLFELVSRGTEDIYIIDKPMITIFKTVYKRHLYFSI